VVRFSDISLERKLKLITMLASGTALLIASACMVVSELASFHAALKSDVAALTALLADNCVPALTISSSKKEAKETLSKLTAEPHIIAACVYDRNGNEFAHYVRDGHDEKFLPPAARNNSEEFIRGHLALFRRIVVDNELVGSIYVESDLDELYARLRREIAIVAGIIVASLGVAYALSSRLQKLISGPLLRLADAARTVSKQKNYTVRVRRDGNDELGLLIDGFNEMLEQIQQRDDVLREAQGQLEKRVDERTRELQAEISERKNAERVVQQQLTRISLLNRITHAISERQDVQSILSIVLRQIEQHLSVGCGAFYLFNSEKRVLSLAAVRAKGTADPASLFQAEVRLSDVEAGKLRECLQGVTVYLPDSALGGLPVGRDLDYDVRSVVAVPLMIEAKLFGLLLTARRNVEGFSSGECEFLKMLCEQVALAGYHAQLYTELQGAYDELRQTQQTVMQTERLRALGQMASGIAHDINNALSPVMGFAELLLQTEKNISPTGHRYLRHIQTASGDITHIVARLREFYRQRQETHELKPVVFNALVEQVIDLTRPRWRDMSQERGVSVQLRTELCPSMPVVQGIESELREALINLILNAVDALPRGGEIIVRTAVARMAGTSAQLPSEVIVEVSDTGIGMDEETRKRCLEPFFSTKGVRGTGLGLAMVYGVLERHEGRIEIDSAPGEGTTMRLVLPVRAALPAAAAAPGEEAAPLPPLRILFVDDEPLLRQLVQSMLENDGHRVTVADGGESGLALFRQSLRTDMPFNVVITDLGMPGLDGRKLTVLLKQESPGTPVIMLTGWGALMRADDEVPVQVDCVLSKPPRVAELRTALAKTVRAAKRLPQEPVAATQPIGGRQPV